MAAPGPHIPVPDTGVFFLLNGILCQTADETGTFRPSDVFEAPDQAATAHKLLSLSRPRREARDSGVTGDPFVNFEAEFSPAKSGEGSFRDDTPDLDDLSFNTCGVLSQGVLIDPFTAEFVDFTTPDAISVVRDTLPQADAVCATNSESYATGAFDAITPHTAWCLWSSVEPVSEGSCNRAGAQTGSSGLPRDEADFPAWPHSNTVLSHASARFLADRHVEHLAKICSRTSDTTTTTTSGGARERADALQRWRDVETIRLRRKVALPTQVFLTPSLSIRLQYHGHTLDDEHGAGGLITMPHSPASLFPCYTGSAMMEQAKYRRSRYEAVGSPFMDREPPPLRVRLRPLNTAAATTRVAHPLVDFDKAVPRRLDPRVHSNRRRAWLTFTTFFPFLGVTVHEPQGDSCDDSGRVRYALGSNEEFSASACVMAKHRHQEAVMAARMRGPGDAEHPRPPHWPPSAQISAAWDYLLLHQKDSLMERLSRVEAYLHKLERHCAAAARPGTKRQRRWPSPTRPEEEEGQQQ